MRIGYGYDVHRLAKERKLIIGGVDIPYTEGLLGHSDADVLVHAVCDALLGAMAYGDIGHLFPDTDERYKDVNSLFLLAEIKKLIDKSEMKISNIDSTIIAQAPKLAPYITAMRENIARTLDIPLSDVSVKATTEEGLGFTGEKLGIAASAVCLLENKGK